MLCLTVLYINPVNYYVFIAPARDKCQLFASFSERLDISAFLDKLTFAHLIKNLPFYGARNFVGVLLRPWLYYDAYESTPLIFKVRFNIILLAKHRSPKWFFPFLFWSHSSLWNPSLCICHHPLLLRYMFLNTLFPKPLSL